MKNLHKALHIWQCYITCQQDFLRLHFAVDQFKGMTWKEKNAVQARMFKIKIMALKIPILILVFVYFANFILSLL